MIKERGRPRTFDTNAALDAALKVFWRKGFLSASLSDLTDAMNLNKPSLYAAFGDKESLYLQALQRYFEQRLAPHAQLLEIGEDQDPRQAVHAFLVSLGTLFSGTGNPRGCLVITGVADIGSDTLPRAIDAALKQALHTTESKLKACLAKAQRLNRLPAERTADELASFFMSTIAGLAVLAKGGATQARLRGVIETALSVWPVTRLKARSSKN